ncbi:MAG TPA: hypothetical protein PLF32_10160 [Bacteroidales bacterium]|nr:hypothetical protein [Bacteroidales bacterium]
MKVKDYEIYIKSSSPEVREVKTLSGGYAFIGVDGENYSIHIKNNNSDYRIWASLHIDGVPAMLDGWGRLAEPNNTLFWDGFQIDENTEREFVFVANDRDSVAFSKGIKGSEGIIEIKIVRETTEWKTLSQPEPFMMSFMTGMGEYKESKMKQAKIKFKWGGPSEIVKIPYGSVSDLIQRKILDETFQTEPELKLIKENKRWYKITIEKNFWDSFSFPPNKKTICYALIDSNSLVTLYKGQNNASNVIDYSNIELSHHESNNILNIVNSIVSDPIKARKELDDSDIVPHVAHINPIYLTVERYNNSDLNNGTIVISWECNAMFAENGLLKDIIECMKV